MRKPWSYEMVFKLSLAASHLYCVQMPDAHKASIGRNLFGLQVSRHQAQ